MPPGRRRIPTPSKELIIPLALGLTAAIASVGLYLWPDPDANYSSGSSGDEREKERRHQHRKFKTRRQIIEHDRITEEDTDAFDEDFRRDELLRKGKQTSTGTSAGSTMMSGALQLEKKVESAVVSVATKAKEVVVDNLPGKKKEEAVKELKKEAAAHQQQQQQYVPLPPKKKSVAVVVTERKALEGHDSDSDYEETGLPSSLLSHLPRPLDLSQTTLNILISSPHLSTHPLAHFAEAAANRLARKDSTAQSSYFPAPRRVPSVLSPNASTYTLATSVLPVDYPLEHILPFTDGESITPLLRTLAPEIVYIEEPMTIPSNGKLVAGLLEGNRVGSVVVVLVGEDDQFAGLIDSEDEESSQEEVGRKTKGEGKWWGDSSPGGIRAKFGSRVQVVEGWVLMEDWRRRIEERA